MNSLKNRKVDCIHFNKGKVFYTSGIVEYDDNSKVIINNQSIDYEGFNNAIDTIMDARNNLPIYFSQNSLVKSLGEENISFVKKYILDKKYDKKTVYNFTGIKRNRFITLAKAKIRTKAAELMDEDSYEQLNELLNRKVKNVGNLLLIDDSLSVIKRSKEMDNREEVEQLKMQLIPSKNIGLYNYIDDLINNDKEKPKTLEKKLYQ